MGVTKKDVPCNKRNPCPERSMDCHCHCQLYKEWVEAWEKEKEKQKNYKHLEQILRRRFRRFKRRKDYGN